MSPQPRMRRLGHDPGDPLVVSHCPFCGSGQIFGLSDASIQCELCGMMFLVRVQPAFPGMPQAPMGPGAASDIGPEGPAGAIDEGMPMEDAPGDEEDAGGDGPPWLQGGDEGDAEDDDEGPPGPDEDEGSGPPPPKSKKKGSHAAALATDCMTPEAQYSTSISSHKVGISVELPVDLHLTEAAASQLEKNLHNAAELVLAQYFSKKGSRHRTAHIEHSHEEMTGPQLRFHMRDQHGFRDSPDDPDWLIAQTHRDEHADSDHDHVHPDLAEEFGYDSSDADRDWLHGHGIEGSRTYRTVAGDQLPEEAYIRHLAVLHSGGSLKVLASLRQEAVNGH
jgi:hypothetical protein